MVKEGKGRIFRRTDGKYMYYIPLDLATDSMFPFPLSEVKPSVRVKVSFQYTQKRIIIEEWKP